MKSLEIKITELDDAEWNESINEWDLWYKGFIRAYVGNDNIVYIKKNAKFIFPWSREDLILYEVGHILGYHHRWMGVMAYHGLFRL